MSKTKERTLWAPLNDALDQAKTLNDRARKLARDTADEVRQRSEAAIKAAQKRSERTLKLVRSNFENAQRTIEQQTDQLGKLPEVARKQFRFVEDQLRKGVETLAHTLQLATERDVEALRRKVSQLEKRVSELSRESAAA